MKAKHLIFSLLIFTASLFLTGKTNAGLSDIETASSSFVTGAWETGIPLVSLAEPTATLSVTPTPVPGPEVNLYSNREKTRVGFIVNNIADYTVLEFKLTYTHDSINEMTTSEIPLNGQNQFTDEWIVLGTCSAGGTCVYYNTNEVNLEVILTDNEGNMEAIGKSLPL